MKTFLTILFLSITSTLSMAQLAQGQTVKIDTNFNSVTAKPESFDYYIKNIATDKETNEYIPSDNPLTYPFNKIPIYRKLIKSRKPATVRDTFYFVADSDKIEKYYNETKGRLLFKKCYVSSFFNLMKSAPTKAQQSIFDIDTCATKKIDTSAIVKRKLSILKPVYFLNCILNINTDRVEFDSIIFTRKMSAYRTSYRSFNLENVTFKDTCELTFQDNINYFTKNVSQSKSDSNRAVFLNTIFKGPFLINSKGNYNLGIASTKYNPLYSRNAQNVESKMVQQLRNIKFVNSTFKNLFIINAPVLKNITFENSTFNYPFFLTDKKLDSTVFRNCNFNNIIDLRGAVLCHGSSFKDNFFKKDCNMIIRLNDDIDKMNLDIKALQKIFFVVDWGWKNQTSQCVYWNENSKSFSTIAFKSPFHIKDTISPLDEFTEHNLEQVEIKFQNLREYVSRIITSDDIFGSEKQKIINWLNYQEKQYEKLYFRQHNKLHYLGLRFLEITTNFGYNGEMRFFTFCLWIILIFAFIFRVFFIKEVNAFLSSSEPDAAENNETGATTKSKNRMYIHHTLHFLLTIFNVDNIKSVFVSFNIFFTPKFPSTVFKFSKWFCWLILIEWIMGILFILLFLYFIAGNYPIVTKLIGL